MDAPDPGLVAHVEEDGGLDEPGPGEDDVRRPVADLQEVLLVREAALLDDDGADVPGLVANLLDRVLTPSVTSAQAPNTWLVPPAVTVTVSSVSSGKMLET